MLDGIHKIHLIGIGGSGMRAIANILIQKGYDVSGSDVTESAVIEKFRNMGEDHLSGQIRGHIQDIRFIMPPVGFRLSDADQ